MIKTIQLLIVFAVGLCSGLFIASHSQHSSTIPINTPFCFLVHNRELFVHRRFLTTARITLDVHGELISDPACLDSVLSFTSSPTVSGKVHELDAELTSQLANHGYAEVSTTFVGTLNHPSRMEEISIWLKRHFGIQVKRGAEIKIDQIISIGQPMH